MAQINFAKDVLNIIQSKETTTMDEETFIRLIKLKYKNEYPLIWDHFDIETGYIETTKESYILYKNLFTLCFVYGHYLPETIELEKNGAVEYAIPYTFTYQKSINQTEDQAKIDIQKFQKAVKVSPGSSSKLNLPIKSETIWEIEEDFLARSENFLQELQESI